MRISRRRRRWEFVSVLVGVFVERWACEKTGSKDGRVLSGKGRLEWAGHGVESKNEKWARSEGEEEEEEEMVVVVYNDVRENLKGLVLVYERLGREGEEGSRRPG
jgi:hypothetical protein